MNSSTCIGRTVFTIFLFSALCLALAACEVTEHANRNIGDGRDLTAEQLAAQRAAQNGEVLRLDRPYYGSEVKAERGSQQGKPFPKILEGAHGIAIRLPGQVDISTIAQMITQVSDIPVNIRTRYVLPNGETVEVPIDSRMQVNYEGPLSRFMD